MDGAAHETEGAGAFVPGALHIAWPLRNWRHIPAYIMLNPCQQLCLLRQRQAAECPWLAAVPCPCSPLSCSACTKTAHCWQTTKGW